MQGAELPAEAVSGLPGGAGDPAGVGERGASSANHQPGYQLLLRPVSLCVTCSRHSMPTLVIPLSRSCIRARQESLIALTVNKACPCHSREFRESSSSLVCFSVVFGNSNGLAVVDYLQKTLLVNMGTSELYSPSDPYQRQPRSPRKQRQPSGGEPHSTIVISVISEQLPERL